jgi:hypothetical protein
MMGQSDRHGRSGLIISHFVFSLGTPFAELWSKSGTALRAVRG